MSLTASTQNAIVRSLLNHEQRRKYQNPKLETRRDCARPYYFIRVRIPETGKPKSPRHRQVIGFLDEMSTKEAMSRRAEILEVINSESVLAEAQVRFSELVRRFKESRLPQFGAGTRARYTSLIDTHILPAFGTRKLCDIDKQAVEAWLASKEKLSWWSREGLRGVLSSIFVAAKDWDLWSGDNPASGVHVGRKKEAREKRLVTVDQLRAILPAVSENTRFMILIAIVSGLRISEICGLQWRDIDLEAGTLTVRRRWYRGDLDEPKSEASRRVRQIGPLVGEFRLRLSCTKKSGNSAGFVFLGDDGVNPVDEREILRWELRPVLKRLGLYYPGFGWHAFRRANVSWRQTVGGATPFEAQKAAGHTRLDMTMLYSLTDVERERGQVQAIMDKLMGGTEGMKQCQSRNAPPSAPE